MLEKLRYECPKCGKTGEFENWEGSPYSVADQPIRMICGTCATWKNYEATGGKVKGLVFVITQQY